MSIYLSIGLALGFHLKNLNTETDVKCHKFHIIQFFIHHSFTSFKFHISHHKMLKWCYVLNKEGVSGTEHSLWLFSIWFYATMVGVQTNNRIQTFWKSQINNTQQWNFSNKDREKNYNCMFLQTLWITSQIWFFFSPVAFGILLYHL